MRLKNLAWVLPIAAVNTVGYLWLNHHPLFERHALPLTAADRATPFWPWTVWPYLLLLCSDVVLPVFIDDREIFHRTLRAYAVAIACNFAFWALWPTVLPRPPVPLDASWSSMAYRALIAVDAPGNCFPSGHITIPAVAVWGLARARPKWSLALWLGLGVLSLSILTTKQHYAADLVGGFATAAAGVLAAHALLKPKPKPRLAGQES